MKTRIVWFDEFALELSTRCTGAAHHEIRGAYGKFLGRAGDPHVTWIFEAREGRFTPHFTAGTERHFFDEVPAEAFTNGILGLARDAAGTFVDGLEATTPDGLAHDGWTVHAMNLRAIRRWLRLGARTGRDGEFRVNRATMLSLIRHVMRTGDSAMELKRLPSYFSEPLLLIRRERDGFELCGLFRYVDACRISRPDGSESTTPAGWYLQRRFHIDDAVLARVVSPIALQNAADELAVCLGRYPKAQSDTGDDGAASELPDFWSWLLGFFGDMLLRLAVATRWEVVQERAATRSMMTRR